MSLQRTQKARHVNLELFVSHLRPPRPRLRSSTGGLGASRQTRVTFIPSDSITQAL